MSKSEPVVFDMNLDLNFVNNHNLRIGNLNTAYQAFREVVGRHPGQPFAQYFLGKCLEEMGVGKAKVDKHYKNFQDIIQDSTTWRDAAVKWGLELSPEFGTQPIKLRA